MKLGDHNRGKVAEPDFWGNFSFVPNLGTWVPNGPLRKIGSINFGWKCPKTECDMWNNRTRFTSGKNLVLLKFGKMGPN